MVRLLGRRCGVVRRPRVRIGNRATEPTDSENCVGFGKGTFLCTSRRPAWPGWPVAPAARASALYVDLRSPAMTHATSASRPGFVITLVLQSSQQAAGLAFTDPEPMTQSRSCSRLLAAATHC